MRVPIVNLPAQYHSTSPAMKGAFERVMSEASFIRGPELELFEQQFAKYIGAKHAVGVGSGGDALYLALCALQVSPGDEVIVPVYTYIATAFAVSRAGATPVFVDCDETYGMDMQQVGRALTAHTLAVMPVHLAGQSVDMDALFAVLAGTEVAVIEDAAQATGAEYKGRRCGSMGTAGCFSFYPSKNLGGCGDGGCITTNDDFLANRFRALRNYGQIEKYVHAELGVNSRLDGLQAALLSIKLPHLDQWNERRRCLAARYKWLLRDCPVVTGYQTPVRGATHVYHLFSIESPCRNGLRAFLTKRDIGTGVHYPTPIHKQVAYNKCRHLSFPVAERLARTSLSLPMCPYTTVEQVEYVCSTIWEYAGR